MGQDEDAAFDASVHDGAVRTVDAVLVHIEVGVDEVAGGHQQHHDAHAQCHVQLTTCRWRWGIRPSGEPAPVQHGHGGGGNGEVARPGEPDDTAEVGALAGQVGLFHGGQAREGASTSSVVPATVRA